MATMIDIETLGPVGCVIFSIGLVRFNEVDIFDKQLINVDIRKSRDLGFSVDPETALWWKLPERRMVLRQLLRLTCDPFDALTQVIKFIGNDIIWAHGTDFDIASLEFAWRKMNIKHPRFAVRDSRTLIKLADIPRIGNPHHPLEDAENQVKELQQALRKLNIGIK